MFNPNDITIGQMERFQEISGMEFMEFLPMAKRFNDGEIPTMPVLKGMAYLMHAVQGSEMTDAELKNVSLAQLTHMMEQMPQGEATPA